MPKQLSFDEKLELVRRLVEDKVDMLALSKESGVGMGKLFSYKKNLNHLVLHKDRKPVPEAEPEAIEPLPEPAAPAPVEEKPEEVKLPPPPPPVLVKEEIPRAAVGETAARRSGRGLGKKNTPEKDRIEAVRLVEAGESIEDVAELLEVGVSTVAGWRKIYGTAEQKVTEEIAPEPEIIETQVPVQEPPRLHSVKKEELRDALPIVVKPVKVIYGDMPAEDEILDDGPQPIVKNQPYYDRGARRWGLGPQGHQSFRKESPSFVSLAFGGGKNEVREVKQSTRPVPPQPSLPPVQEASKDFVPVEQLRLVEAEALALRLEVERLKKEANETLANIAELTRELQKARRALRSVANV